MGLLEKEIFLCVDCETTGLDVKEDQLVEVGAVLFTIEENLETFTTLINPGSPISAASQEIHRISDAMVADAPSIKEILPDLLNFLKKGIFVGHGVDFDLQLIARDAEAHGLHFGYSSRRVIDTLRLARLYQKSPVNSLEGLRRHFGIPAERAHRALDDALVNAAVFRKLAYPYKRTESLFQALSRPIKLKRMPLGKYKGELLTDIPLNYLKWAVRLDFDQDLRFTIRQELSRRKQGGHFQEATNPFRQI